MGKKKIKVAEATAEDQMKTDAINECKRWVDTSSDLYAIFRKNYQDAAACMALATETRITWLERAALVLQVDVRRCNYRDDVAVAWATSEGDIIRLEEADVAEDDDKIVGDPMYVFDTIEDLLNMQANFNNLVTSAKSNETEQ